MVRQANVRMSILRISIIMSDNVYSVYWLQEPYFVVSHPFEFHNFDVK